MSRKIDLESMFPDPVAAARLMRAQGTRWSYCPGGHELPHRLAWGRCSPVDCVDAGAPVAGGDQFMGAHPGAGRKREMDLLPQGQEKRAMKTAASPEEAEKTRAQTEEALSLMKLVGIRGAREALHPTPEIPARPDLKQVGGKEYVKQRLADIAPAMLERKIFTALYNPGAAGDSAAEELLDRAGFPRKADANARGSGPVMFVVGMVNPYEQQKADRKQGMKASTRILDGGGHHGWDADDEAGKLPGGHGHGSADAVRVDGDGDEGVAVGGAGAGARGAQNGASGDEDLADGGDDAEAGVSSPDEG